MSREIELPESIRNLPRFVSPREIVQTKYHAIAWTQRATLGLQHQPLERLLLVYPDFGKPSINEVVCHYVSHLNSATLMHHIITGRTSEGTFHSFPLSWISRVQ